MFYSTSFPYLKNDTTQKTKFLRKIFQLNRKLFLSINQIKYRQNKYS